MKIFRQGPKCTFATILIENFDKFKKRCNVKLNS